MMNQKQINRKTKIRRGKATSKTQELLEIMGKLGPNGCLQ